MVEIEVVNTSNNNLPEYEHDWDAGCDVRADFSKITPEFPIKAKGDCQFLFENPVNKRKSIILNPRSRAIIPTGLIVSVPKGYELQVRPRSGLSYKTGLTLANCIGTIDTYFRDEVGVIVINNGFDPIVIEDGERIGQLVLNKVSSIKWVVKPTKADFTDQTDRGGGYGSTGVK